MTAALWYLGRGTGVSALVLFTLVVVLGMCVRAGQPLPGLPRFAVTALHRTLSLTAVSFLAVHIVSLTLDPYAQLRLIDIVIPFQGTYRPLWQGLGTVAFDLIVVLVASSLLRDRIGLRAWRVLHWAAYACWPAAILHTLGNGTDRGTTWLLLTVAGCVAAVAAAGIWRVTAGSNVPVAPSYTGALPPRELAGLR